MPEKKATITDVFADISSSFVSNASKKPKESQPESNVSQPAPSTPKQREVKSQRPKKPSNLTLMAKRHGKINLSINYVEKSVANDFKILAKENWISQPLFLEALIENFKNLTPDQKQQVIKHVRQKAIANYKNKLASK